MKNRSFFVFLFLYFFLQLSAQEYIPYEVIKAIRKGTRTINGIPGEAYFQNHASYSIQVKFDPYSGKLSGKAEIEYFNESPDSLRKIVMRLYQNSNKKGGIRDEEVAPEVIHDGVVISSLTVNNEDLTHNLGNRTQTEGTNFIVYLKNALVTGTSCRIHIEWEFVMPDRPVKRYGKYDAGTYFVSLWYPQIAVYDDIDGWDETYYTGTHEFYNDFNDYNVSVVVPKGYMVWATGTWQNPGDILSKEIQDRYNKAMTSENIVHIIDSDNLKSKNYYTGKGSKTFIFEARKIPDFAFAVSDHYLWDATTVFMNGSSESNVMVSAVYPAGAYNFDSVAELGKKVIQHFYEVSYNTPYPFPAVTVFKGEGGMEYPMIVNNGARLSWDATIYLTMHEIAHAYFPFLTGINEHKYSWIDEGLTTYLPFETQTALGSKYYTIEEGIKKYNYIAGTVDDIPLSVPTYQTRGSAYQNYSYVRSSVAFYMLENYIGRDTFRMAIRNFIETWQYKHPTACDLFAVIENTAGRDIGWFIDSWFYGSGWPDLAIGKVTKTGYTVKMEVKKEGLFPVPVLVELRYLSGEKEYMTFPADVWKNKDVLILTFMIEDELGSIHLGNQLIPDKNPLNNTFTISDM
jgi:hypothetical protein